MKKSLMAAILSAVLSLMFAQICLCSCSGKKVSVMPKENTGTSVESKKIKIGFSIDTLAIERWQRDLDVFMGKIKELGAECIVQNSGNNVEEQARQIMYLCESNCDVIVVLPKEAHSLKDTIEKVKSRNIPVISYDRLIMDCDIDLYISIDSEKVGEIMGREMPLRTDAKKYYCILGPEEDYNMALIQNGVKKSLEGTDVEIADTFYTKGWNYDLSRQKTIDLLMNGIAPEAIICGNDAVADSVITVLKTYYPGHHVTICGQDADIAACQNIVNGDQDFTVYKPITELAESAAVYACRLAEGVKADAAVISGDCINNGFKDVPTVWLEPVMVDKNNIDKVIIDSGFHTYGEVYR